MSKELLKSSLEHLNGIELKTHGLKCLIREIEKEITPLTQTITIEWFAKGEKQPETSCVFFKVGDLIFDGQARSDGQIYDLDNELVENWTHFAPYVMYRFFPFEKMKQ